MAAALRTRKLLSLPQPSEQTDRPGSSTDDDERDHQQGHSVICGLGRCTRIYRIASLPCGSYSTLKLLQWYARVAFASLEAALWGGSCRKLEWGCCCHLRMPMASHACVVAVAVVLREGIACNDSGLLWISLRDISPIVAESLQFLLPWVLSGSSCLAWLRGIGGGTTTPWISKFLLTHLSFHYPATSFGH